jgi:tetratricopeptide (TPR) repeat protein
LVARNTLDWPVATNHLLKANDLTRSTDGLVLVSLAGAFRSLGNASNAAHFAQMAEQNAGNRWDVFQRLAKYYFRSESQAAELRHARACCEQALRYSPASPLVRILLGQILVMQNQPARAKEEFDRAIKLRRTANELSAIGSVYLKVGNCAQSLDYFLQASRADPSKYLYHVNAGIALRQCSNADGAKEQFGMALAQIENTLRSSGENGLARAYCGFCRAGLGQSEQARADLESALQEARLDLQVLRVVRRAYQILGDGAKVREIEELLRQSGD